MASIRQLKKDIDYLVSQVVIDCFLYNRIDGAEKEASYQIMEDMLGLGGKLRKRLYQTGEINDKKALKNHYREIGKDLLHGCDEAYNKLKALMAKAG
jgi:hypothetical protein